MSVIKLKGIEKNYEKNIKVLKNINLTFEQGTFNSIIGQSGSGKSTLLNIIGTLDKPTKGSLYFDDKLVDYNDIKSLEKIRNEKIGFVFQFHYLLPEFSVLDNVLLPVKIKENKVTKEKREETIKLLNLVGVKEKLDKKPNQLSGGQMQRVAIARALINHPKVILADEPTGNLDSDTTEKIYELMRNICYELKTTFIIITHDKKIAEKADRIVEIKDGKIELDIDNK
ncbi:MAG: ABC transporter ATP-binding protein [Bacilli bacterium]|nr:ABC transporter ATP-binding protein [Bacilli bacterium]